MHKLPSGKGRFFSAMQKLGSSFMLPMAVLPAAGLLLGIGASFTNPTTLQMLGLANTLKEGNFVYMLLSLLRDVGSSIFDNLPLLFAIGLAIGFADKDKEIAAFNALLSFLILHVTIHITIISNGLGTNLHQLDDNSGMLTTMLGIKTLQMGAFGGIITGLIVAKLNNRFRNIQLPDILAFFGGSRFIPIICTGTFILLGIASYFIWPFIQKGINTLGGYVTGSGAIGTFLYAFIKRLLVPFGLHHVFYMPFWQTSLGGVLTVAGNTCIGAQQIVFSQLADPNTAHISSEYARYFMTEYPSMIFGLPCAALAMYHTVYKENKKKAKSYLTSTSFTCLLTGVTEPIEFPILFASPILYLFHALMCGICGTALYLLNFAVVSTFSQGLIDFVLFGILPGNAKTSWVVLIPVGIACGIIYYTVFRIVISKFKLRTIGREEPEIKHDIEEDSLTSAKVVHLVRGLGGLSNIVEIDNCSVRLRCLVRDASKIDEAVLKSTEPIGVMHIDTAVQIIYGPSVNILSSEINEYIKLKNDIMRYEKENAVLPEPDGHASDKTS